MSWEFTEKMGKYPTDGHYLGDEVPLGQGKVNYSAFIAKLKEIGYQGDITIEREISGEEPRQKRYPYGQGASG